MPASVTPAGVMPAMFRPKSVTLPASGDEARQHPDQGGFASSILAHEAMHASSLDLERRLVERPRGAELLDEAAHDQGFTGALLQVG